jgi:hypothetical protein
MSYMAGRSRTAMLTDGCDDPGVALNAVRSDTDGYGDSSTSWLLVVLDYLRVVQR